MIVNYLPRSKSPKAISLDFWAVRFRLKIKTAIHGCLVNITIINDHAQHVWGIVCDQCVPTFTPWDMLACKGRVASSHFVVLRHEITARPFCVHLSSSQNSFWRPATATSRSSAAAGPPSRCPSCRRWRRPSSRPSTQTWACARGWPRASTCPRLAFRSAAASSALLSSATVRRFFLSVLQNNDSIFERQMEIFRVEIKCTKIGKQGFTRPHPHPPGPC